MNQDYVVLRFSGSTDEAVLAAVPAMAESIDVEEVTIETLEAATPGDIRDVENDPRAIGAPAMPIELVAPVRLAAEEEEDELPADEGAFAWGLEATRALTSTFTGKRVTVAVLDTGIERTHEAFAGRNIVEEDFTGRGNGDENGHGTHCAGTIFGGDVGGVRIGIAQGIEKALIGKVLDDQGRGSTRNILNGILWAVRNNANIISMSLTLDFPGQVKRNVEEKGMTIQAATSMALQAYRDNVRLFDDVAALVASHSAQFSKAIVLAAAGNDSKRPAFEIATAPPAVARGFLSVGALRRATGNKFRVAAFSNALPKIAGPGVDVRSAQLGGGLTSMNGTSMATPHVAGIAALWMQRIAEDNPKFHITELEGRLIGSAAHDAIDRPERANTGAGMVFAPQS